MRIASVILAPGHDPAMRSATSKILHRLAGRPMVHYAVETASAVTGELPVLVTDGDAGQVQAVLSAQAHCVPLTQSPESGHVLLQARDRLATEIDAVLVVYADMPLLSATTLRRLVDSHTRSGSALTMLTVSAGSWSGSGRVMQDSAGRVSAILDELDGAPDQTVAGEHTSGIYCFDAAWLWSHLPSLPAGHKDKFDLSDVVSLAITQGCTVNTLTCEDATECSKISSRVDLAVVESIIRARINRRWMEAGVTLVDPNTIYIDESVSIESDTLILPNTFLLGHTRIGSGCRIGPSSVLDGCEIGNDCVVMMSVLEEAVMEDESDIGPFSHLRKGSRVCSGAHMGNFGEMKNSTLGPGAKMGHFSYLGDATIGANVNIGCGTITCNFDGVRKNKTVVEDDAFIGSDSMLVAPVHIGRGAKTGAGSVVTHDIPAGAVAYGVPARVKREADDPVP